MTVDVYYLSFSGSYELEGQNAYTAVTWALEVSSDSIA